MWQACTRLVSRENTSPLRVLNEIRAGAPGIFLKGEAGSNTRSQHAASDLNMVSFI